MALVSVNLLKTGAQLAQDVLTLRGSLLMNKGTFLTPREIEILQAFLVPKVRIEGAGAEAAVEAAEDEAEAPAAGESLLALYKEYDLTFRMVKQTFALAAIGHSIPVLDIRTRIERLLAHIDEYNLLLFKPPQYTPQDYIYHQGIRVALTSYLLAKWHDYQAKDLIPIALAGLLHDIGNCRVDAGLLLKPGSLTASEFEQVRSHTVTGYSLLKNVTGFNEGTKLVALQHHEREDGSGYPLGLYGDKIHPYAKVVAVADIYHAMSANRLYRAGLSPYQVLEELLQYSFGKLDPAIVRTFIAKVTQFHMGTIVKLSDGRIGEIVFTQREHPTRPWVSVSGVIVNLTVERGLYIQEVIKS